MDFIEEAITRDRIYRIAVIWTETGVIKVNAKNVEDAIRKANETKETTLLPEGEYLDGSFEIDVETTKILNQAQFAPVE